jgi:hypothetical protein
MKTPQAIFSALVAALALAAFVAFYDSYKPDTEMARHANEAAEKTDLLTPASSIAHDFAVLPASVHSTRGDFDRGRICRNADVRSHSPGTV